MRDPLIRAALHTILPSLLGFLLVFAALPSAYAEMKPQAAFGAPAQQSAPPAFSPQAAPPPAQGPFGGFMNWVMQMQASLHRELAAKVKGLKDGNALAAALALAGLSFIYGVLHAVGPGHGKAVISSYVVANEETVRRGVMVSFLAAGLQALTAVALVSLLLVGFNATGLELTAWTNHLETASYALIALVGLYLLVTQAMRLWRRRQSAAPLDAAPNPGAHVHGHQHHHAHHHHEHGEDCGHVVDASKVAGPFSWRKVMAVVFSVGIRPCTGAILVLVFALAQGLFWAGVAATFAMALGTAITVAVLATLAIGSRELALKLGGGNSGWTEAVWTICAMGGALVIFLLGSILLFASLGPARPF
jgi:ABC-type nickel/cobalt efflux system permease component RcnA